MHTTLLNGFSQLPSEGLSPLQSQVDGLVGGFIQQATDWRSLAAMTVGGAAYRLGRVGVMAAGMGSLASVGIGLGAEVTAFEMTHRSLASLTGEGRSRPNLWRWEGNGGIRQGLLSSLITFGSLKGMGRLAQGENLVVQHLLQDTGMVFAHQVSAFFGITPRPTETLAEQFLHAEATNVQLSAGMALGHGLTQGRIHAVERGLELSLHSTEGETRFSRQRQQLQPALLGPPSFSSESRSEDSKQEGLFRSSSLGIPPGGRSQRTGIDEFGIGPETPLEKRLRKGLVISPESLRMAIWYLLEEIPSGPRPIKLDTGGEMFPPEMILEGRLRYRRLEILHRLLIGGKDPKEISVVDNGPWHLMDTAVTLAKLGSTVVVKEPGDRELEVNRDIIESLHSPEIMGRITLTPADETDLPTPSDVVYWTNPCVARLEHPPETPLGTYLSRDVKPGGYLVLQTDHLFENDSQGEFLQLNLDPGEWESIFSGSLENHFPEANYILPTAQTHDLHLQIYRRKPNPSVAGTPDNTEPQNDPFPYFQGQDGRYHLPSSPMTVAVLEDVAGTRTRQLAVNGHHVIHIQKDAEYLMDTQGLVENLLSADRERGRIQNEGAVVYLIENELTGSVQADLVEAFYLLNFRNLPQGGPERDRSLSSFLETLNSKLKPKGTGYVVLEDWDMIADLSRIISANSDLELVDIQFQKVLPLIAGGNGSVPSLSMRHSWLIYRKN